jgi:hypothetical protein
MQTTNNDNMRSPSEIEELVVFFRLHLYDRGIACGPKAILRRLDEEYVRPLPSERTVARILARNCLTNGRTGYYPEDYPCENVQFPAMSGQGLT